MRFRPLPRFLTATLAVAMLCFAAGSSAAQIISPTNALGTVGQAFGFQIAAVGGVTNYTASNLPSGLLAPGTNGLITGLPQVSGVFTSSISAVTATNTNTTNLVITVNPPAPPVLASPSTFFGMQGEPLLYRFESIPNHSNVPTRFGVSGTPPFGLNIISNVTTNTAFTNVTVTNYFLSGTVLTNGTFVLPLVATNNLGGTPQSVTNNVTFVIQPAAAPEITSPGAANAIVGVPFSFDVTAINSPQRFRASLDGGVTWTTNGALTNGLSFSNVATGSYVVGRISGTPSTTNTVLVDLEAINEVGPSPTQTLTITVGPPQPTVILSQPLGEANFAAGSSFYANAQAFDRLPDTIVPSSVNFTAGGDGLPGLIGRLGEFYGVEFFPSSSLPSPFDLQVTAQNSLGQTSSFALPMNSFVPANTFPVIQMLPLLPGPQIQAGGSATLRARASTPSARTTVDRVEFYVNKVFVGSSSSVVAGTVDEYQFQWQTPAAAGAFEVSARVISQNGTGTIVISPGPPAETIEVPVYASVITRTPVVLNTAPGVLPSVSIIAPTSGAQLPLNVSTRVVASANVFDGSIQQVQFYVDGRPLGAADVTAPYAVDFTPASYGTYQLFAIATSSAGLINISPTVTVTVPELVGASPTVTLNAPTSAKTGQVLTFTANAKDSDGSIASVQFLANGVPLPTPDAEGNANPDLASPYRYAFAPGAPGRYELIARATDNSGNVTDSKPVVLTVTVGTPPSSFLTTPNSARATAQTNGSGGVSGYTMITNGSGYLTNAVPEVRVVGGTTNTNIATATALVGSTGTVTNVVTNNIGSGYTNGVPTVVIDPPPVAVGINSTVLLQATAGTTNGTIRQVEFLQNGLVVGTATTTPYNFSLPVTSPGRYELVARTTDNLGNVTDSPAIFLNGVSGTAPTVSITTPSDGLKVPQTPLTVSWNASDADGSVTGVQLLVNGAAFGAPSTSGSGAAVYTPSSAGSYVFVARATDNLGNVTDSAPVTVTIDNTVANPLPLVNLLPQTISDANYVVGSQLYFNATAVARTNTTLLTNTNPVSFSVISAAGLGSVNAANSRIKDGANDVYSAAYEFTPVNIASSTLFGVARATNNTNATITNVGTSAASVLGSALPVQALPSVEVLALPPSALTNPVAGGVVQLRAKAAFPGTNVANNRVEFYAGGAFIGIATNNTNAATLSQFTHVFNWTTPTNTNNFTVRARAVGLNFTNATTTFFGSSLSANSTSVNLSSNTPPTVSITTPASNNAVVGVGISNAITATATAAGSASIREVQFYLDGIYQASVTNFPYTFNFAPASAGLYNFAAVAIDSFGLQNSSAVRTIKATTGTPPTVALTSPANNATLNTGQNATLAATASDLDGAIAQVEFLINGLVVNVDTAAPYRFLYPVNNPGLYEVVARATDNLGNVTDSAARTFSGVAGTPPTVSITSPSNGATIPAGLPVTITANASDQDGSVASVTFYQNGAQIGGPDTQAPYSATFTPSSRGQYTLVAVAQDNSGNLVESAPVVVTVPSTAVTATVVSPVGGSSFTLGTPVILTATAGTTAGSTVTSIRFEVNNQTLGAPITTAPYTTSFLPSALGSYSVRAVATDSSGNTGVSPPVVFTVQSPVGSPPSISLSQPSQGNYLTAGSSVFLNYTTFDAEGEIDPASLRIFVNGVPLTTPVTQRIGPAGNTFGVRWIPGVTGTYVVSAQVSDLDGNTASSGASTINVLPAQNTVPQVTIEPFLSDSQYISVGVPIELRARAKFFNNTETEVEFYANSVFVGTGEPGATNNDGTVSYTLIWAPDVAGSPVTLTARAVGINFSQAEFTTDPDGDTIVVTRNVYASSISSNQPTPPVTGLTIHEVPRITVSGSNEEFVKNIFPTIFNRSASYPEYIFYVNQLQPSGNPAPDSARATVIQELMGTVEYNSSYNVVYSFYYRLGLTPTGAAAATQINLVLNNPAPEAGFATHTTAQPQAPNLPTLGMSLAAQNLLGTMGSQTTVGLTPNVTKPLSQFSNIEFLNWLIPKLGGQAFNPTTMVSSMNAYSPQSRRQGAVLAYLTQLYATYAATNQNIADARPIAVGAPNPQFRTDNLAYDAALKVTTLRFLQTGDWTKPVALLFGGLSPGSSPVKIGAVELGSTQSGYALRVNNALISVSHKGAAVTAATTPGKVPVAAFGVSGGYHLFWRLENGQYEQWNVNARGGVTRIASLSAGQRRLAEAARKYDINGDGVIGQGTPGIYMGSYKNSTGKVVGRFAFHARENKTGTAIAYDSATRLATGIPSTRIDARGRFVARSVERDRMSGRLADQKVTGTFYNSHSESDGILEGRRKQDSGAFAGGAGSYQGRLKGIDPGRANAIVAADGSFYFHVVVQTASGPESSGKFGQLDPRGRLTTTLGDGIRVKLALDQSKKTVSGEYFRGTERLGTILLSLRPD
jgi:hypothetical protein